MSSESRSEANILVASDGTEPDTETEAAESDGSPWFPAATCSADADVAAADCMAGEGRSAAEAKRSRADRCCGPVGVLQRGRLAVLAEELA